MRFLKSRSRNNIGIGETAQPLVKAPEAKPELVQPDASPAKPEPVGETAPASVDAEAALVEEVLASPAETTSERYKARENADGWSVHDSETDDVAAVYGYSLARMNRARAESLAEVLNRGDARGRRRNG